MDEFQEVHKCLISTIEKEYSIELTLGEKLSFKECLRYAQEVCFGQKLQDPWGEPQINEAHIMWLRQYGIRYRDINTHAFKQTPEFYETVRKNREDCLLI